MSKLSIVRCSATNMQASVRFYRDLLGLPLKFESAAWSEFDLGSIVLGLHQADPNAPEATGGWVLSFEVDDIKEARGKLESAGVSIPGDYHDIPGGVTLGIKDPDGNPVDLVQYRPS